MLQDPLQTLRSLHTLLTQAWGAIASAPNLRSQLTRLCLGIAFPTGIACKWPNQAKFELPSLAPLAQLQASSGTHTATGSRAPAVCFIMPGLHACLVPGSLECCTTPELVRPALLPSPSTQRILAPQELEVAFDQGEYGYCEYSKLVLPADTWLPPSLRHLRLPAAPVQPPAGAGPLGLPLLPVAGLAATLTSLMCFTVRGWAVGHSLCLAAVDAVAGWLPAA